MRSLRERVIHTTLFEILAVLVVTPVVALATGIPLAHAGTLSLLVSLGAVATNYGWTVVFDRLVPTRRRGVRLRFLQAAGLEVLIAAYTIPLILWWTNLSLAAAAALDLAGVGFFLVYAMAYNVGFDAVVLWLETRRHRSEAPRAHLPGAVRPGADTAGRAGGSGRR